MKAPLSSSVGKAPTHIWQRLLPLLALFVFLGSGFQARAQKANSGTDIIGSTVVIDRGQGNESFGGRNPGTLPPFSDASLGTFDVTDFGTRILLNGGTLNTQEIAPDAVLADGVTLIYRLRRNNADGTVTNLPIPPSINLPQLNTNGSGGRVFANTTANRDILTGLTQGSYSVSVQYSALGINNATGDDFTLADPPSGSFRANFTVIGVRPTEPPTSTTWTGGKNDNWFDSANWTKGVPNAGKDATIPDFGSGSTVQYPNIYSNAVKPTSTRTTIVQNSDGTTSTVVTQVPGYNNSTSGLAETRSFTMQGASPTKRSISSLVVGRLNVFGNFNNQQDSFQQSANTIIGFVGVNQTISGSGAGLVNIDIDGGGIKMLTNSFTVRAGGTLRFINGILETVFANTNSYVQLAPSTNVNNTGIQSGRIEGETETSFLRGEVRINEVARVGETEVFGNIGVTLNFIGNAPGVVNIQRFTNDNFASVNNGPNSRPTIRRFFRIEPSNPGTETSQLNATLTFRYLDNELTNLSPDNQTLDESKLALYVSTSTAGNVFGQLGRDALVGNILTKSNISSFGIFSLSELTAPLPVTLTAFNAKRVGSNAEITWETVAELNSRGYEVQVSNDGRNFRALTFVASTNPNSNQLLRYRYTDTEAGKTGVRYYRLRQIDLDGTDHYYAPKVVTFDGSAVLSKAEVRAFPNPFSGELFLTANTSVAGPAQLSVTDMTGRVIGQQTVQLNAGINDVSVPNVANLQSGIYLVRLVLASGEAKVLRVSKN